MISLIKYLCMYQYFIKKHQKVGQKHFKNPNTFAECSNDFKDVFKSIEEYNP